jgi:hypothetical protein
MHVPCMNHSAKDNNPPGKPNALVALMDPIFLRGGPMQVMIATQWSCRLSPTGRSYTRIRAEYTVFEA